MRKILLLAFSAFLLSATISRAQVWIEQNSNFSTPSEGVLDISAVDDNTAWILGYDGTGAGANFIDYALSTDGGNNFVPGTVGTDTTYRFSNITAVSATTAWVAMFNNVAGLGGGIWQTTDGGASWLQQGVGLIYDANSFPDVVHFWNANDGVTIGDPNNGYFEIYTTTDGGSNWNRVLQANIPANLAGEAGITNWYDTYGDNIWFYTSKGRVYHSADKGYNWTVSQVVSLTTAQGMTVKFLDANYGIAQIYVLMTGAFSSAKKTTDGGATWTAFTPSGNFWTSDLVAVPNSGIYVSSGAATGLIGTSFSEDSGMTWIDIEMGTVQYTALGASSFNGLWAGNFSGGFQSGGIFKWDGTPMGIMDNSVDLKTYNVYPNPSEGLVTLNFKTKSNAVNVQVVNTMGEVVFSQDYAGVSKIFRRTFDFSNLSKGIYSLVLTSGNELTQEKIVIQ